jgi:hypothetical protein
MFRSIIEDHFSPLHSDVSSDFDTKIVSPEISAWAGRHLSRGSRFGVAQKSPAEAGLSTVVLRGSLNARNKGFAGRDFLTARFKLNALSIKPEI